MAIATGGKRLKGSRHAGRIGDSHKESPFAAPTLTNLKIEPHVALVAQQLAMDAFNVVNVFVLSPTALSSTTAPSTRARRWAARTKWWLTSVSCTVPSTVRRSSAPSGFVPEGTHGNVRVLQPPQCRDLSPYTVPFGDLDRHVVVVQHRVSLSGHSTRNHLTNSRHRTQPLRRHLDRSILGDQDQSPLLRRRVPAGSLQSLPSGRNQALI